MQCATLGLNSEHIQFIIKDLPQRGLLLDDLQDEIVDHVCSAVEARMSNGERFIEAYEVVVKAFGHTEGLQQKQK